MQQCNGGRGYRIQSSGKGEVRVWTGGVEGEKEGVDVGKGGKEGEIVSGDRKRQRERRGVGDDLEISKGEGESEGREGALKLDRQIEGRGEKVEEGIELESEVGGREGKRREIGME